MANLKVSIIEKIKLGGKWTNKAVEMPKLKANGKDFYLRDYREGKFLLVWREDGQKKYSESIPNLPEANRSILRLEHARKDQNRQQLLPAASYENGTKTVFAKENINASHG